MVIVWAASLSWLSSPSSSRAQAGSGAPAGKHFDQVVIVVLENEGTDQALADPYIASLTRKAAWFSHYYAITHPSFPNYLALVAGSTFGIDSDHRPAPLKGATIADRLEEKGLTWKSYAEDYPGGCYLGSAAGAGRLTPTAAPTELYVRKHVPLLAFASIESNPGRCARVVGASQFMRDARAGKLPNYSFYTWDEGGGRDNRVLTLLRGTVVNQGRYPTPVTHYSLLRTIEDNFGLSTVGAGDKKASPFPNDVWR